MKKRVFSTMDNAVYRIVVDTEDWSQGDIELMDQFGEPEVDVGGSVDYMFDGEVRTKEFGHEYIRILHGFPYSRGFDSRDYGTDAQSTGDRCDEAVAAGNAWKDKVLRLLDTEVESMRAMHAPLPTEEVSEI